MFKRIIFFAILLVLNFTVSAQISVNSDLTKISYSSPKEYEVGGITVSGIKYLDHNVLIQLSGLNVGDKIFVPGEEIAQSIKKLWSQGLFSDVKIYATKIVGDLIFLEIYLQERPRLSIFTISGVKKSEAEDIKEERIKLVKGGQVTDNILSNTKNSIEEFFIDKGYLNVNVDIVQEKDTVLANNVILHIKIDKNERVKINDITFEGNLNTADYKKILEKEDAELWKKIILKSPFSDAKLRKAMKDTKRNDWWNIFKASKFIDENYEVDKQSIIDKYHSKGYRDAIITSDTVYNYDDKTLNIHIKIDEGKKYYFRNITWVGNTKYTSKYLNTLLGLQNGDIFDQSVLDQKIYVDPAGVFSLYQNDGYLFFNINPVEVLVENDSIDLEMRIYEGKQARVNNVTIVGNNKTNEHVIRREIRTKPGQLYSRADVERTIRELAQLNYFDPEKLDVKPTPNPVDGTVDLEFIVEEKASDQIELSGGWGGGYVVGTLGVSFNNFSAKNMFNKGAWRPLPAGDGQKLSVRAQSNGRYYQAYSMSFVEPWLGGKKPNSLSTSVYHTIITNGRAIGDENRQSLKITGVSLGLGKRLKAPDDFFTLYNEVSYQNYLIDKYNLPGLDIKNGTSNNISFKTTFGRNSIDQPIYPRRGSSFSISLQLTPPYSAFKDDRFWELSDEEKSGMEVSDIQSQEDQIRLRWIEYHKWTFKSAWYSKLAGDLVLVTKADFGFLGMYNKDLGPSPFESFQLGGDGLTGYSFNATENIALRGYENNSLTPDNGGHIYDKITMELRYPLSLNPSATVYVLGFLEGGNAWYSAKEVNPFSIKRSAGFGVRIFLPMFGMLGVDWGYGFDEIPGRANANKSQFHFVIGQQF